MAPLPSNKAAAMPKRDDDREGGDPAGSCGGHGGETAAVLTGGSYLARAADLDDALSHGAAPRAYPAVGAFRAGSAVATGVPDGGGSGWAPRGPGPRRSGGAADAAGRPGPAPLRRGSYELEDRGRDRMDTLPNGLTTAAFFPPSSGGGGATRPGPSQLPARGDGGWVSILGSSAGAGCDLAGGDLACEDLAGAEAGGLQTQAQWQPTGGDPRPSNGAFIPRVSQLPITTTGPARFHDGRDSSGPGLSHITGARTEHEETGESTQSGSMRFELGKAGGDAPMPDLSRQSSAEMTNRSSHSQRRSLVSCNSHEELGMPELSRQATEKLTNRTVAKMDHDGRRSSMPDIGTMDMSPPMINRMASIDAAVDGVRMECSPHYQPPRPRQRDAAQGDGGMRRVPSHHVFVPRNDDDQSDSSVSALDMGDFGMGSDYGFLHSDAAPGCWEKRSCRAWSNPPEEDVDVRGSVGGPKVDAYSSPEKETAVQNSLRDSMASLLSENVASTEEAAKQIVGEESTGGGGEETKEEASQSAREEARGLGGSIWTASNFIKRGVASWRSIQAKFSRNNAGGSGEEGTSLDRNGGGGSYVDNEEDWVGGSGDLLHEAQYHVSMSMLVYIYAQLREMAVLGYTDTDFRQIDVNSYLPWQPDACEDTVPPLLNGGMEGMELHMRRGARRASMVSELGSELSCESGGFDDDMSHHSLHTSSLSLATYTHPKYLLNTKSAGFVIRVVLSELEHEKMCASRGDLRMHEFKSEHDTSIMKEFQKWINNSKAEEIDAAAEEAIMQLREKVMGGQIGRNEKSDRFSIRKSIKERRSLLESTMGVNGNWYKLQRRIVEDHFGLDNGNNDVTLTSGATLKRNMTPASMEIQNQLKVVVTNDMIDEVMERTTTSYFKEGSVLNHMVQSGIEVAWFGDRHPNEATYCICVCRHSKTVTVVFRGSANAHNWLHNLELMMTPQKNPVAKESYDGRADFVRLHTGFGLYLLKRRKGGRHRKLDEIFKKVEAIGQELAPEGDYRVSVAGHSLGGALAAIFSFYAAAEKRFTRVAPVRVFTFAAPRVGDQTFADAYRHLELTGRVLHGRFANCRDIVPLLPTFSLEGLKSIGPWYQHVGLQAKLHEVNILGKYRTQHALDVTCASGTDWWSRVQLAWKNNFISNINTLGGFMETHILSSYYKRIRFARECKLSLSKSGDHRNGNKKSLKTLEEYYKIRANIPSAPETSRDSNQRPSAVVVVLLCSALLTSLTFHLKATFMERDSCSYKTPDDENESFKFIPSDASSGSDITDGPVVHASVQFSESSSLNPGQRIPNSEVGEERQSSADIRRMSSSRQSGTSHDVVCLETDGICVPSIQEGAESDSKSLDLRNLPINEESHPGAKVWGLGLTPAFVGAEMKEQKLDRIISQSSSNAQLVLENYEKQISQLFFQKL